MKQTNLGLALQFFVPYIRKHKIARLHKNTTRRVPGAATGGRRQEEPDGGPMRAALHRMDQAKQGEFE
ncbi:hypothetical protein [Burkholderia cepacia]|uniref:hypothetical protein n=1 Tax=Burkholderia cepacia TaxID=292 RepID=UPI0012D96AF9|nr:hypothetical protein [Burkholderia cepacia]MBX3910807.1 hypothetical protein [Burkholderia cepacia]